MRSLILACGLLLAAPAAHASTDTANDLLEVCETFEREVKIEGANIDMLTHEGEPISSPGPYDDCGAILQAYHPLPEFDGNFPVVGSWIIADEPVGMGIREDATLITRNTSRFVPHAIID